MKRITVLTMAIILAGGVGQYAAAEKHGSCNMCHIDVEAGEYSLVVNPNYYVVNPNTGRHFDKADAMCMACHSSFNAKTIHPVGIIPAKVSLPPESKGKDGREEYIGCNSCHDIHSTETSYMYLRWGVKDKSELKDFCVHKCHKSMAKQVHQVLPLPSQMVTKAAR